MDSQNGSSDGEDIPSDFFDDFAKEDFIEGLSVVDSWDDSDKKPHPLRTRIKSEDVNKVKDLRDLIDRDKQGDKIIKERYRWRRIAAQPSKSTVEERRSGSATRMDSYIKPGSRRDPNKTNKAIKKDKEEKVKEYLAKHLESSDDIRPPGTELDDFFEAKKAENKKQPPEAKAIIVSPPKERVKIRRESPMKRRECPPFRRQHWSPRRPHGPAHSPRRSPWRSPRCSPRRSPRRFSPRRMSPRRGSPQRFNPQRLSPSRIFFKHQRHISRQYARPSPDFRRRKSRSPVKRSFRRSHSRSTHFRDQGFGDREIHRRSRSLSQNRIQVNDDFLYPKNYYPPEFVTDKTDIQYSGPPAPNYTEPMIVEYPGEAPSGFSYPQGAPYAGYAAPYEYGAPPATQMVMPVPQPVPAPILPPIHTPIDMTHAVAPVMVPAPQQVTTPMIPNNSLTPHLTEPLKTQPADALAKLVADGIISHEDYLKLVPNKGAMHTADTNTGAAILSRCNTALSKIGNIMVPTRLIINNNMLTAGPEKNVTRKFSSPLKRQQNMQFHFTKTDASTVTQRNKQIVESLISTLNVENVVGKRRKPQKETKDAETQTTKPFCDVCEIRESTTFNEMGTCIDREHIFSSVQTQVVDHDLVSSKSVFNPSVNVPDSAPMSIAHLTPAQLVSQLAARAKTLKNTDSQPSNQYRSQNNYEGRAGGSQYQQQGNKNYNYRSPSP
ncbi:jg26069 [Pararge aegeria aegeria]|uniref:Jg26069 protein n=3 Tax=Pararge aegeria TaxID=116150 RepID=A0A8S4RTR1_9NEOP|nr:jg26069 [Pararge aegeria aegeria]